MSRPAPTPLAQWSPPGTHPVAGATITWTRIHPRPSGAGTLIAADAHAAEEARL